MPEQGWAGTNTPEIVLSTPNEGIEFNVELHAGSSSVDIYIGYITPGGRVVSLLLVDGGLVEAQGIDPIITNFIPIDLAVPSLFQRHYTDSDEPGDYLLFAALVSAGEDPMDATYLLSLSTITSTHSDPSEMVDDDIVQPGVSFSANVQPIFTDNCAVVGCHAGPRATLGQNLEAGQAYSNIVGVQSVESSTLNRIQPGDPDNSYLVQKIRGTAAVGAQMPLGQPPLSDADIATIVSWITAGALNN